VPAAAATRAPRAPRAAAATPAAAARARNDRLPPRWPRTALDDDGAASRLICA